MKEISNKKVVYVNLKSTKNNLKDQAHLYFDKLWKLKYIDRDGAYKHMAEWFNVEDAEVHMRTASPEMCKEIIYRSIQVLNDLRRCDLDWGDPIKTPYYELK